MSTMTERKHSPLPWHRFDADSLEITANDSHEVCNVFQCGGIREVDEADANAELIINAVNSQAANQQLIATLLDTLKLVHDLLINQSACEQSLCESCDIGRKTVLEAVEFALGEGRKAGS